MKQLFCALTLLLALSVPAAHAAPPSQAQLGELFKVMDLQASSKAMMRQMEGAMTNMAKSLSPPDATAQDRQRMNELLQEQMELTRAVMTWDKLEPIYRKAYGQVFNAAEVQAMIDFYSTENGRSILRKMPQAMGVAMREMQPLMAELMKDTRQAIKQGMHKQGMQSTPDADQQKAPR